MKNVKQTIDGLLHIEDYLFAIKEKSDIIINYFLAFYFSLGLLLAFYYDTWQIAIGVGSLSLIAYYSAKIILPKSNFYQYVLSVVLGIFMAQFIYQMHGLFEMHFTAFVGSAILITYQNWKLQIPLTIVVVAHHALFGYLQYIGYDKIYFTQLDYMSLQTFIIHGILAAIIFFICGLWAYQFKVYSERHIDETFNLGKLEQKEIENTELKKSNKELDNFVYSVSHDLRAPLSSMLGVIGIAKFDTNDPVMLEHIKMLEGSINKLDGFVIDILDYSRNARMEVEKEEINLKSTINEVVNHLKYMGSSNRKVDIEIEVRDDIVLVTDKQRMDIILNNLISNAIRYQNLDNSNPIVNIKAEESGSEVSIVIRDNGIGINPNQHLKIFDMFYRVSEKSIGSGLGLYIVKEAVNKLNGTIDLQSEFGKGSTFIIKIPKIVVS